jgi:hypothetical protein
MTSPTTGQQVASGRMKRVKRGCCFRLEYGPRMGRMCGAEISGYSRVVDAKLCSDLADYCLKHQDLIFRRRAKEDPLSYLGEAAPQVSPTTGQRVASNLEVTEGIAGYWHYHISRSERPYRALCGAQAMGASIRLADWRVPFGEHLPKRPTWCAECERLRSVVSP